MPISCDDLVTVDVSQFVKPLDFLFDVLALKH